MRSWAPVGPYADRFTVHEAMAIPLTKATSLIINENVSCVFLKSTIKGC